MLSFDTDPLYQFLRPDLVIQEIEPQAQYLPALDQYSNKPHNCDDIDPSISKNDQTSKDDEDSNYE